MTGKWDGTPGSTVPGDGWSGAVVKEIPGKNPKMSANGKRAKTPMIRSNRTRARARGKRAGERLAN